jgi:hypothetical protein
MRELIKALKIKGAKELVDQIVILVDVQTAQILPDSPEKLEKLKSFLRAVRRLQASTNVVNVVKGALYEVFRTDVLFDKIENSAERFTMGALTTEGFCNEIYWHVKHQLHWILTMYEADPTKFPNDLDTQTLYGIITRF